MSDDNKAIVREILEEGYNKNNLGVVEETHARDFTLRWIQHKPATTEDRGPDATKARINRLRKAFPDFHLTTDTMVADGDMVAVRWTITGTHRGDFVSALGTFPPTGNYVKTEGISIFRLSRGKIVEEWISYDRLGLLQQTGAAPETSELVAKGARK